MLTTEDIQRLVRLKAKDKEAFHKLLNELKSAHPLDVLLSHAKFKDYAPNVATVRTEDKVLRKKPSRAKAIKSKS
jgi:hypothetical protein